MDQLMVINGSCFIAINVIKEMLLTQISSYFQLFPVCYHNPET